MGLMASTPGSNNGSSEQPVSEMTRPPQPPGVPESVETSRSDGNSIPLTENATQYLDVSQQSEVLQQSRVSEPSEPLQFDENSSPYPSDLTQSSGSMPLDENGITIHIINDVGGVLHLHKVSKDQKISVLMKKSLARFYTTQKKFVSKHFVILIRTNVMLKTSQTVKQSELLHNDELLLVEKLVVTAPENTIDETPKLQDIETVTKKMKTKNKKKKRNLNTCLDCNSILLQMELDNIYIALVDRSAHLLRFNNVSDIFKDIVKNARLDVEPDRLLLSKLTSMGYAVDMSTAALILMGNNLMLAVEWLTTESASVTDEDIAELLSLKVNYETIEINSDNFCEFVKNVMRYLLKIGEILNDISKENIKNLKKIGFQDENHVKRALRKCSDEPNKACLFLLGETLDEHLSNDRPVPEFVDKILSDPDNLVALSNEHMLIALINYFLVPTADGVQGPESVQGRKYTALLIKIAEAFETEKYFSHGCREPPLVIQLDD
uniref:UBA domain-containing protein n=1 Tax=Cacopsylla melanoneura TaxID=428564 RepID=A0A8D8Z6I4_9HEMI